MWFIVKHKFEDHELVEIFPDIAVLCQEYHFSHQTIYKFISGAKTNIQSIFPSIEYIQKFNWGQMEDFLKDENVQENFFRKSEGPSREEKKRQLLSTIPSPELECEEELDGYKDINFFFDSATHTQIFCGLEIYMNGEKIKEVKEKVI